MQSRARSRKDIIKAALTVVLGLILLGVFIVALGGRRFWENYDYYAIVFDSVKDLSAGRPVKYAGLDIGRVEDISIDPKSPGQVLVRIAVKQGFPLFNGTFALISQKGLVGDNYVFLQLQGQAGQQLKPGSHIPSKQVMSLNELANQISDLVNELRPKLLSVADGLNDLLAKDNREKVRQALEQLTSFLAEAETTIKTLETDLSALTSEAQAGVADGRLLIRNVDRNIGTTLQAIRSQVTAVGDNLNTLTVQLQGDLDYTQEQVDEVLNNASEMTKELKLLSRSLRERPWQVLYPPEKRPNP